MIFLLYGIDYLICASSVKVVLLAGRLSAIGIVCSDPILKVAFGYSGSDSEIIIQQIN